MPELPEVEVVRAGLDPAVRGSTVEFVDVLDTRSLKRHDASRGGFESLLTGRRIASAVRRGKFLWFPLDSGDALVAHLGMSGQMLLREPGVEDGLTRIVLGVRSPEHGELRINFVDQRIFGSMAIDRVEPTVDGGTGGYAGALPDGAVIPSQVAHIARDPIDPDFDADAFHARLRRTGSAIKRVLLDQRVVSGIGNIYADEALWAAQIHYETPARDLAASQVDDLLGAVRDVLERALAEGGTSFDQQYVNVNGASGYFAHSLNAYGQQGRDCPRCGDLIVRAPFMNRSSHFCPRCQTRDENGG